MSILARPQVEKASHGLAALEIVPNAICNKPFGTDDVYVFRLIRTFNLVGWVQYSTVQQMSKPSVFVKTYFRSSTHILTDERVVMSKGGSVLPYMINLL